MTIAENIQRVRDTIRAACDRSQRDPGDVRIVAVSKTAAVPQIREAIEAGIEIIGENRVQEARAKAQQIHEPIRWHMIGHLQTNKVKGALEFASAIESLDSLHLAEALQRQAERMGRTIEVFVQVNTSGETSKFGISPDSTAEFVSRLQEYDRLHIVGLMTIARLTDDPEKVRPSFRLLRHLRDRFNEMRDTALQIPWLSMGMTDDYTVAVEEGATHLRIGRAIFGER
ncbi:YggS family pyridoxal phosphate-dependent enzyme [candidate division KSB1 bacterium]|nr:YggS family pyridoxal phosphate-dependent enzyme [candidate division KSB1 bacterium]